MPGVLGFCSWILTSYSSLFSTFDSFSFDSIAETIIEFFNKRSTSDTDIPSIWITLLSLFVIVTFLPYLPFNHVTNTVAKLVQSAAVFRKSVIPSTTWGVEVENKCFSENSIPSSLNCL